MYVIVVIRMPSVVVRLVPLVVVRLVPIVALVFDGVDIPGVLPLR